jgi:hypothetical protein
MLAALEGGAAVAHPVKQLRDGGDAE